MRGFLLTNNDFMLLNKDGISFLSLGEDMYKDGREVKDKDGLRRKVHSLGTCDFLKI